jgi:hypothetical protein
MSFRAFTDADGDHHVPISGLSLVVLEGRPAWLRQLRDRADSAGLLHTDFIAEMTRDTCTEQLDRMKTTPEQDLEDYGIAVFGARRCTGPVD